jgi:hypothetical protein
MTCREYLDHVAADVDGVLGEAAGAARLHLQECPRCRVERERQQAVRGLLRSRVPSPQLPLDLRARVLRSLAEAGSSQAHAARHRWTWARAGALAAAAVALMVLAVLWDGGGPLAPLVHEYRLASQGALSMSFATGSREELEKLYREHSGEGIAAHVVDLSPAGFDLVGGVLEDFPGRRARITVYSDGEHLVLCDFLRANLAEIDAPADGSSSFFRFRGLTFRVRRVGDHVCVLITRMPIDAFRRRLREATESA